IGNPLPAPESLTPQGMMTKRLPDWAWKSFVAGLGGTIAHTLLMAVKTKTGLLPSFQLYEALQITLSHLMGSAVPSIVPWIISYMNGSSIVGLFFGSSFRLLPGNGGAMKGAFIGVVGWLMMGFLFFPLLNL